MKILRLIAHNVMRLSEVDLNLEGHHLFLVGGKNANGKTSVLRSVLMALCGKRGCDYPEIPLKDGEKSGSIEIDLSGDEELHDSEGFKVMLEFNRRRDGSVKETFKVLDSTGEEAPEPRTLLKKLFSLRAFDPLEFERMDGSQQVELMREMAGVSFDELNAKRKELYEERTIAGREAKRLKSRFDSLSKPEKASEVSVAELMGQLQAAEDENLDYRKNEADIGVHEAEIEKANKAVEALERDIEEAQRMIAQNKEAIKNDKATVKKLRDLLATKKLHDLDEIREKVKQAEDVNRRAREYAEYESLRKEVRDADKVYAGFSDDIRAIDDAKLDMVKNAKWPVPDMSMDDDGILLAGRPFKQASRAERILASTRIGMALNPKLKLLVCEDGSDLDADSLKRLDELLKAEDYQMVLELVTRTEQDEQLCAVVIEDGSVKEAE